MGQLRATDFVHADTLDMLPFPGMLQIRGEIACRGNIVISVLKVLDVLGGGEAEPGALVQTSTYNYNASIRGFGNFLRYDNAHSHPGHSDPHHRHLFDWRTNQELPESPEWIGEARWPTLGAFITEVNQWYWGHLGELPEPDRIAELGVRGR